MLIVPKRLNSQPSDSDPRPRTLDSKARRPILKAANVTPVNFMLTHFIRCHRMSSPSGLKPIKFENRQGNGQSLGHDLLNSAHLSGNALPLNSQSSTSYPRPRILNPKRRTKTSPFQPML